MRPKRITIARKLKKWFKKRILVVLILLIFVWIYTRKSKVAVRDTSHFDTQSNDRVPVNILAKDTADIPDTVHDQNPNPRYKEQIRPVEQKIRAEQAIFTLLKSDDILNYLSIVSMISDCSNLYVIVSDKVSLEKQQKLTTLGAKVLQDILFQELDFEKALLIDSSVQILSCPVALFSRDLDLTKAIPYTDQKFILFTKESMKKKLGFVTFERGIVVYPPDVVRNNTIAVMGPLWKQSDTFYQIWRTKILSLTPFMSSYNLNDIGYIPIDSDLLLPVLHTLFRAKIGIIVEQFSDFDPRLVKNTEHGRKHRGHTQHHHTSTFKPPKILTPHIKMIDKANGWKIDALSSFSTNEWVYITATTEHLDISTEFFVDIIAPRIENGKTVYMDCHSRSWMFLKKSRETAVGFEMGGGEKRVEGIVEQFLKSDMGVDEFEKKYWYLVVCI